MCRREGVRKNYILNPYASWVTDMLCLHKYSCNIDRHLYVYQTYYISDTILSSFNMLRDDSKFTP